MLRYTAFLPGLCAVIVAAKDGLGTLGRERADLVKAGVDLNIYDSYQYKQIVPYMTFADNCTSDFAWDHEVHPNIPHSMDTIKFTTCFNRPVTVDSWNFTLTDTCEDKYIMRPTMRARWRLPSFGTNTRVVDGITNDVIDYIGVELCVKHPADYSAECWGEWINKPAWDYEWIVKIPFDGIYDKEKCGAKFEEAIKEACAPFEMTKFDCEPHPPGAWIRFRHNLLCGRTRIQNALKKASNGEMDVRCPYFAEIPVPP